LEKQLVVNIDHHSTCDLFGDINWIDPTASAVGEMIYNLCKAMGVRVSKEIAECVYTALMTDTGSFHYSNTTDRTFKVASELVKAGAQPAKLSEAVYNSYPWAKLQLLALVMATAKRDSSNRIAYMRQSLEMLETTGADECDGDGFVNILLTAGSIEAAAFLKEKEPGVYRTSLRSKGDINVARVAEKLGGGGHRNAAGCTLRGTWEEVENTVIQMLNEAIEKAGGDVDKTEDALIHPTVTTSSTIEAEVRR
jgi:phosphoesterase RecJ-like protein